MILFLRKLSLEQPYQKLVYIFRRLALLYELVAKAEHGAPGKASFFCTEFNNSFICFAVEHIRHLRFLTSLYLDMPTAANVQITSSFSVLLPALWLFLAAFAVYDLVFRLIQIEKCIEFV
jgi:hypothetical protein